MKKNNDDDEEEKENSDDKKEKEIYEEEEDDDDDGDDADNEHITIILEDGVRGDNAKEEEYEDDDDDVFDAVYDLMFDASIGKFFKKMKTKGKSLYKKGKDKVSTFRRKRKEKKAKSRVNKSERHEDKVNKSEERKQRSADTKASRLREKLGRAESTQQSRSDTAGRRVAEARSRREALEDELSYLENKRTDQLARTVAQARADVDASTEITVPMNVGSTSFPDEALRGDPLYQARSGALTNTAEPHDDNDLLALHHSTVKPYLQHYQSPVSSFLDKNGRPFSDTNIISSHEIAHLTWSRGPITNQQKHREITKGSIKTYDHFVSIATSVDTPSFDESASYSMQLRHFGDIPMQQYREKKKGTFVMEMDLSRTHLSESDLVNRIGELIYSDPLSGLPLSLLFHMHHTGESKDGANTTNNLVPTTTWDMPATEDQLGGHVLFTV